MSIDPMTTGRLDRMEKAAERPQAPIETCLAMLEKDAVALTQVVDQLDERLAAVLSQGVPHPEAPTEAPPGESPLVCQLMLLHHRLVHDLERLDRMTRKLEVG